MPTFAETVSTCHTPVRRPDPGTPQSAQQGGPAQPDTHLDVSGSPPDHGTPQSAQEGGPAHPAQRQRVQPYRPSCPVCQYRSQNTNSGAMDMATHTVQGAGGDEPSPVCRGAALFTPTYAQSLDTRPLQAPRWLETDFVDNAVEHSGHHGGSPPSPASSPASLPASPPMAAAASGPNAMLFPCSAAALEDIYAELWQSTDPADLSGLLAEGAQDSHPDPDGSDADDPHTDTDSAAAASAMGDPHVLAIIEHIITTCTPVAEAHRLLSILQEAGTVPWKTLDPYVKVLRQWQSECGRVPVMSQDLRTKVRRCRCVPQTSACRSSTTSCHFTHNSCQKMPLSCQHIANPCRDFMNFRKLAQNHVAAK